jgi:hypothetical protein
VASSLQIRAKLKLSLHSLGKKINRLHGRVGHLVFWSFTPNLVGGIPTPLKNMKVSWDDFSIPNIWKSKIHVPNHLPEMSLSSKKLRVEATSA